MSDEQKTLEALLKTPWLWLIPFAGGAVDWLDQWRRGLLPQRDWRWLAVSAAIRLFTACFTGTMSILAVSYFVGDNLALFGIAGGGGGWLGTRTFELGAAIIKWKTGFSLMPTAEVEPPAKKPK